MIHFKAMYFNTLYIIYLCESGLVSILPNDAYRPPYGSYGLFNVELFSGNGIHCTTQAQRLQWDKHLVPSGQSLSESQSLI